MVLMSMWSHPEGTLHFIEQPTRGAWYVYSFYECKWKNFLMIYICYFGSQEVEVTVHCIGVKQGLK